MWTTRKWTTHGRQNHALRSRQYRYIHYANGSEELYDHNVDPMEWKNLADDPRLAEVKAGFVKWLPAKNAPDAPFDPEIRSGKRKKK